MNDLPECWLVLYSTAGQRDWFGQTVFDDKQSCETWIQMQRDKTTDIIRRRFRMRPIQMVPAEGET